MEVIFLTLGIALAALVLSGRWIVKLLLNITAAFGISEFSVAFIFLAVATSIPELFVSIASAQASAGDLVIAIALGSNVVNMTLIVGLATIVSFGISTQGLNLRRDIGLGMIITLLPVLFLLNGVISRFESSILLASFVLYMYLLYRDQKSILSNAVPRRIMRGVVSMLLMLVLVAVLIFASEHIVESSVTIATLLGIPSFLIGLFLLAGGTSLPELTTTLQSALQKKPTLALGNILGSNVADAALIVGIASMVKPLEVTLNPSLIITALSAVIALGSLGYFAFSRQKISFSEGLLLLLGFVIFSIVMLLISVPEAVLTYMPVLFT